MKPTRRPVPAIIAPRLAQVLDLLAEDSWRNVYAGELEVRPPAAPTTQAGRGLARSTGKASEDAWFSLRKADAGYRPVFTLSALVFDFAQPCRAAEDKEAERKTLWPVSRNSQRRRTSSSKELRCCSMADALSLTMTRRDFENGYWYLDQLKHFADRIGIPAAKKLRKDELEKAIVAFLRTGRAALPTERSLRKTGVKDVERGLDLKLRIENYTSNRETKDFIVEQARLMAPEVREKSGVWYRLNRWREDQITIGKLPTYGELVRQYIVLNKMQRFEKVPHGRYINFVAEFLAADKRATRAEAIAAWTEVKKLDVPKNYASWIKARAKRRGRSR
jgi:hypothetical protein